MDDEALLYTIGEEILACVQEAMAATTSPPPARAYVTTGQPAWDDCCAGQLVVWWSRVYASSAGFPDSALAAMGPCAGVVTGIEWNVEVMRCAPGNNANGKPPTLAQFAESARITHVDARAVWRGVRCCLQGMWDDRNWMSQINGQAPSEPDGGCVGSKMTFTIGVGDGCGCT